MIVFYCIVFGMITFIGGSALYAFYWAATTGQFADFENSAESIFGDDEPLGEVSDVYPGMNLEEELARAEAKRAEAKKGNITK